MKNIFKRSIIRNVEKDDELIDIKLIIRKYV
jgi:hypothetical protein